MATAASFPRVDALLHVTRQVSKLDPNRLISNIHHIATGGARAPSAWMSICYDLRELEDVFRSLAHAGHDISAAYRDFDVLRRWVHAAASTMSQFTPHSAYPAYSLPRSTPHSPYPTTPATPTKSASQRSPLMTSPRPEQLRPRRATISVPIQQYYHSPKVQVTTPAPARRAPSPRTRTHVRFASTATVYTIPRYDHATLPPAERSPRATRQPHAK